MAAPQQKSVEELTAMAREIIAQPSKIQEMSAEDISAVRKKLINPYTIPIVQEKFGVMSITNMKESYMRRLLMTALIGYLYRVADEYVPVSISEMETDMNARINKCDDPEIKRQLTEERDKKIPLLSNGAKQIVKGFLDNYFNFNPDIHVRAATGSSAPKDDTNEKIRERMTVAAAQLPDDSSAGKDSADKPKPIAQSPETAAKIADAVRVHDSAEIVSKAKCVYQAASGMSAWMRSQIVAGVDIPCAKNTLPEITRIVDSLSWCLPQIEDDLTAANEVHPPVEAFYNYDRYLTNHYEQLRAATSALYTDAPDIEFIVNFYDAFKSDKEAREFIIRHDAEFTSDAFIIPSGKVVLLGPFKQNRERLDFYNKNTEVLKRLVTQIEKDHRVGEELMKKSVKKAVRKNIREEGLSPKELDEYRKAMKDVQALGAKSILTREEKEQLYAATRVKEQFEVPEDAIAVDVYQSAVGKEGHPCLERSQFFTEADKPGETPAAVSAPAHCAAIVEAMSEARQIAAEHAESASASYEQIAKK
ncbi:MAG: hypothetical protein M0R33_15560 [Methylomonas sp.]|jgi:hypothetical protein|uniref:hypothetical protein n=1 Tax=Methylomonas sp. TaxID=418 RepID=UPI0025D58C5C|nr:hypothetical protein [Methylomonas sp.]MCK9607860.1 hypothetical protein [Methylomonas sp.]